MHHCNEIARRQRAVQIRPSSEFVDTDILALITDELVAIWREFNEVYQRFLNEECEIIAFAMELELLGRPRFHRFTLPNGSTVQLYLAEASSDEQVRRTPGAVLGLPRRCKAIDRLLAKTRRGSL